MPWKRCCEYCGVIIIRSIAIMVIIATIIIILAQITPRKMTIATRLPKVDYSSNGTPDARILEGY